MSLSAQKFDCHSVESDSCRIRIVTLSQPKPWVKMPIEYIVVKEGDYFVYYSEYCGSYCDAESLLVKFEGTTYKDARVVVCRKRKQKK
jgi:hypothetical protein